MLQGDTPFLLQPPVRAPRAERAPRERCARGDRSERGDRFDRNERSPRFERGPRREDGEGGFEQRPRREVPPRGAPEQGMETYRISVGHQHGPLHRPHRHPRRFLAAGPAGTDAAGRAVAPAEGVGVGPAAADARAGAG
ncbi:hypothetical protein G6F40_016468 [Rhizopus arrhizus]|nr:hypothetical protein G6F40_016468 [Rhizopus arrhizus]